MIDESGNFGPSSGFSWEFCMHKTWLSHKTELQVIVSDYRGFLRVTILRNRESVARSLTHSEVGLSRQTRGDPCSRLRTLFHEGRTIA